MAHPEPHDSSGAAVRWTTVAGGVARGLVLLAIMILIARAITGSHAQSIAVGAPAPDTYVRSYDGQVWPLSQLGDKPMVVNFWAPWCVPCLQEMPALSASARRHADDVHFVGLVISGSAEEVKSVVEARGVNYPVAEVDHEGVDAWAAHTVPVTYIVDHHGNIAWQHRGMLKQRTLDAALERVLAH